VSGRPNLGSSPLPCPTATLQDYAEHVARALARSRVWVMYGGIGDQVLHLSWLPAALRLGEDLVILTTPESEPLARLFPFSDFVPTTYAVLNAELVRGRPWRSSTNRSPVLCWHHSYDPGGENRAAHTGQSVLDLIRENLGVPRGTPPLAPRAPRVGADAIRRSRLALLVPGAHTIGRALPAAYWEGLARHLVSLGYSVMLNGGGATRAFDRVYEERREIEGVRRGAADLTEAFTLASQCALVVGTHSGFMTLVARLPGVRKVVLYPHSGEINPILHANQSFWSQRYCFPEEDIHELDVDIREPPNQSRAAEWWRVVLEDLR